MRNVINIFLSKHLPQFGIVFLLFIGLLFSYTAHGETKILEVGINLNSNFSAHNITSEFGGAEQSEFVSKTFQTSVIPSQFLKKELSGSTSSIEEKKDLEYILIENFVLLFQLQRYLKSTSTVSLELFSIVSFGKLFILFHRLKIFS